jgi:hypothetical protein
MVLQGAIHFPFDTPHRLLCLPIFCVLQDTAARIAGAVSPECCKETQHSAAIELLEAGKKVTLPFTFKALPASDEARSC